MKYVSLAGRQVSAIGLGTWQFGSPEWGWGRDFGPADARSIVHRALDLGINLFDTAEIYGFGQSELVLRDALQGQRDEIFVATKLWPTRFTPAQVVRAAEGSLKRLGRERIDLYQIHWPNPVVPLGWVMNGMRRLLDSGAVASVGVSNFGLARWRRAERLLGGPVVSNQVSYHLLERRPERELIPHATAQGRAILAYSPLAQGLLSGGYRRGYRLAGARAPNRLYWPENLRRSEVVVDELRAVAAGRGCTPAQIALAWAIRQGCVVAIPGARRVEQVEQNAAAADIALDAAEVERLDRAAALFRRAGVVRSVASLLRARALRDN